MADELGEITPPEMWVKENAPVLIEVLKDSYEDNKATALYLLRKFPAASLGMQDVHFTVSLMEVCVSLAKSIRPADSVTAAYLLRLLASFSGEEAVWNSVYQMEEKEKIQYITDKLSVGKTNPSVAALHCRLIYDFTCLLAKQVDVAKLNIMNAAVQGPLYGTLLCIRMLLEECDLGSVFTYSDWWATKIQIIDYCYAAVNAVEHVVNSTCPEGHLPMDGQLFVELQTDNMESLEPGSVTSNCSNVTSQQVLLCAWRTVKETSLLLGSLATCAPVHHVYGIPGFITEEELFDMGQHFIRLLAEVKHRGAFEQVYVGFSQLCTKLWSVGKIVSPDDKGIDIALHELPAKWLYELLQLVSQAGEVLNNTAGTALCVTRRSAGVPFLVQALLATEPSSTTDRTSEFPRCTETLLHFALGSESIEARTHTLNILRAIFRNSVLSERSAPFIAPALKIAMYGCHSEIWPVRNAATLLFSALVTRLFGVPTARDRHRLRRMTGRLFFQHYPSLYDYFLKELDPPCELSRGTISSQPSMDAFDPYPALLVLSRLYPCALEGTDSSLQLARFVPLVRDCAGCRAERTRILAARALAPLVTPDAWPELFLQLLDSAVMTASEKLNTCHGYLLQGVSLLRTFSTHLAQNKVLQIAVTRWLESSEGLLHFTNFPVAEAYIQLLQELVNSMFGRTVVESCEPENAASNTSAEEGTSSNNGNKYRIFDAAVFKRWERIRCLVENILGQCEQNVSNDTPEPGQSLFQMRATQLLLTLTQMLALEKLPNMLAHFVHSRLSDVALTSLTFVLQTFKHISLSLPFEEECEEIQSQSIDTKLEESLQQSSCLSRSIASLLLLPQKESRSEMQVCCFQLLPHFPRVLTWLIQLLSCSAQIEENIADAACGSIQNRSGAGEVIHWLLNRIDVDNEIVGPSIIATLNVFFSIPEEMYEDCDEDLSLSTNDMLNLCATLENVSTPEYPVKLRHAVACVVSSPSASQFLLHPSRQQVSSPLAVCCLWSAVLQLLDDDDITVRQQAATLALQLPECHGMPVTELRAREILVPTFVQAMSDISPLLTAGTLAMWIMHHYNVTSIKEDVAADEQLFEQSEANDYKEPFLLANLASAALHQIIRSRPDLISAPLPADASEWIATRIGIESSLQQKQETMTLMMIELIVRLKWAAVLPDTRPKNCVNASSLEEILLGPTRMRIEAMRLCLLQEALKL